MWMPLQVTSPGMNDSKTSQQKPGPATGFQDYVCREAAHFGEQPAVVVYEGPEFTEHGEGNVLPFAVGHQGQQVLYPYLPVFYTAVGAGAAFAAETDFFV